jgi:hypothetical protein
MAGSTRSTGALAGMIAALTTATLRAMEAMTTQARHLHPAEFAPPAPNAAPNAARGAAKK